MKLNQLLIKCHQACQTISAVRSGWYPCCKYWSESHYQTVNNESWPVARDCTTCLGVQFVCGFRHVDVAAAGAFSNSAGSDYLDADKWNKTLGLIHHFHLIQSSSAHKLATLRSE